MSKLGKHIFAFDEYQIDVAERVLKRRGDLVPLTQKSFEILLLLVERQGSIVTKEELMETVWPDTFVEESNLAQNIYTLRKALGPRPDGEGYIATVPRRGYRFAAPVQELIQEPKTVNQLPTLSVESPVPVSVETILPVAETVTVPVDELVSVPAPEIPQVTAPPTSDVSDLTWAKRHHWLVMASAGVLLIGLAWVMSSLKGTKKAGQALSVSALTTTGNISTAAISPDGKFVAYATIEQPQLGTLWIEQLATANRRTVLPAREVRYEALAFSPDGDFLYYIAVPQGERHRSLYRVSVLGGLTSRLAENVGTGVAVSPDGKQLAFRGSLDARRIAAMFIANADGSGQRELATIPYPGQFQDPAWSPDGTLLVCGIGNPRGPQGMYLVSVRLSDGAITRLSAKNWQFVGQTAWLKDGRAVLMIASETTAQPHQVWRFELADGYAQQFTNDSNTYNRLSLSAQAGLLAVLQVKRSTSVWLVPANDVSRAQQITAGAGGYRGGLAWTPEGRLVYESEAGAAPGISEMENDGRNPRLLTTELSGRAYVGDAVVTRDGRYVVFTSDYQSERHIWRMNKDGGGLLQLTNGTGEENPSCSPNGRWVYYTRLEHPGTDRPTIGCVSLEGGERSQVTQDFTAYPVIAPDGKTFACLYSPGPGQSPGRLAVYPIEGGQPLKVFPQGLQAQILSWTPDGRAVTYFENPIGAAAKIWLQPVADITPQLFTEFAADRLFGLAWSLDGKQLACVRGLWETNVVLLKGID
jgi:eukaryotic-like serine/threonine-protein kinase